MCGRVIQSSAPIRLAIVDGLDVRDSRFHNYPPRWNGAPSQELLVIRRNRQTGALSLDPLRWGLIPYSCSDPKGGRKPINGIGLLGQLAFDRLPLKEAIHRQYAAPPTVGRIDRHLLRATAADRTGDELGTD